MLERYPDIELQLQFAHFEPISLDICPLAHDTEAQRFKSKLPLDQLDVIYVQGLSDGRPFRVLEDWLEIDTDRKLIFLEDDLFALHRLLSTPWAERMLMHPQVHLRYLIAPVDCVLEQCAQDFPAGRIAVTTMGKKKSTFQSIKFALLRKTVLWNAWTSEMLSGHLLHRNILSNFHKLPHSFYVNRSKGAFKGQPAVICGAGPSLSRFADKLHILREKALLIGCGSALSALSHLKVKPHVGIAIDPNAQEKECLKGCSFRDLPLIYGNRLYPEVFELFDGPYGYLRSPTGSPLEKAIEEELGMTDPDIGVDLGREALSVTTLALSLACFWGCSPIILAGVDLAYSGRNHYAKGVPVHLKKERYETRSGQQVIYRKGAQGKRVATLIKWIMEQQTIDAYTKLYPETTFINATGEGLGFPSIPYRSWSDIEKLISHTRLPEDSFRKLIQDHPSPVSAPSLKNSLQQWHSSFLCCFDWVSKIQYESEGSGKAILYEDELSQEKAYQLTLQPALRTLERIYPHHVGVPFNTQKWRMLQEMIGAYLSLF